MTREEAKKILGEGATEEQVTNLLASFHSVEKAKNDEITSLKAQLSERSDYDTLKQQLDEINKANMTEQERIAKDKEEIAKKLHEANIIVNTAKAKTVLAGLNVNDKIIAKLVSEDETETLNSVNELKTMLELQKDTVEKATKESLVTMPLTPDLSNVPQGDDVMTLEKFYGLTAEEQEKFIAENPEQFKNL